MLFLVTLFLIKNGILFKKTFDLALGKQESGLIYGDATVGDLINKDADLDGVPDWEEPLWGLDPTKKETTPGMPDITVVNKLKSEQGLSVGEAEYGDPGTENLTQTDKFSRELFSTVATLNQTGIMNQATADKISSSLVEHIQNSPQRKIYALSEIEIATGDDIQTIENYKDALVNIQTKYPINNTVLDVLQKFIIDEDNVDVSALSELDPIIEQTNKIITEMIKINVPQSLAPLHLNFINALQRLVENVSDIKLFDTDVIVSLGAVSQYSQNTDALGSAISNLENAIQQKLNN